jgi:outer membrane protein assembly factor BamB
VTIAVGCVVLTLGMLGKAAEGGTAEELLQLDWRKGQPKELWREKVGWGYSGVVVRGRLLYAVGYAFGGNIDHVNYVYCLDAETGKRVWRERVGIPKPSWGGRS